ncbi:MAG: FAD-dependent oxidoreductase [Clostridia bacterium]|nr:FAD-dependent oxidoreductase [Clostridia bacterium]
MTYDIVVIGAGIAGLTAAIYGRRANKKVLVLESRTYGGQIVSTKSIENYPAAMGISGFEFATKIYEQAVALGAEIKFENVMEVIDGAEKQVKTNQTTHLAKTVIIATGSKNRTMGLANEEKWLGRGISYCATCDGAFFKNKVVAVVGGGNTALGDAIYLADIAQKVYLIHRRNQFNAEAALIEQVQAKPNVTIVNNAQVVGLLGDHQLTGLDIIANGTAQQLIVDGLFVAVGRVPENEKFANVVDLDHNGYIVANETCETGTAGIFVAGDCRTKEVRQLVTAAGDAAVAATHAIKYINQL